MKISYESLCLGIEQDSFIVLNKTLVPKARFIYIIDQ